MADLSEHDYRIILGEDFKRRLNDTTVSEHSTEAERHASRTKRAQGMVDLRFSFVAVMFTGLALVAGGLYSGVGLVSVQGLFGAALVVIGIAGVIFANRRAKTIAAEHIGSPAP